MFQKERGMRDIVILSVILLFFLACNRSELERSELEELQQKSGYSNQPKVFVNEKSNSFVQENSFVNDSFLVREEQGCSGLGTINFTSAPRRLEDIEFIEPMGLMIGNHVTPIDHQYYYPPNWKENVELSDLKDVLAPGDGIIVDIQRMPTYFTSIKGEGMQDYRIVLYHTCSFYSIYIHVYVLSPKIMKALGEIQPSENKRIHVPVSAGEVIGQANSFDFSVHDEDTLLKGFIAPINYEREPWKVHTVDPFDYFTEPLKTKLLAKNIRQENPRGGKIDYDIDGKLIGNWFVKDTNGYLGIKQPEYWGTHASFSPDAIDPKHIIISLGDFNGKPQQFGVLGNAPIFNEVSVSSGKIAYELVEYNYQAENGKYWNGKEYAKNLRAVNQKEVKGTVLVELISERTLKLEIFPSKRKTEVLGFTMNAVVYER